MRVGVLMEATASRGARVWPAHRTHSYILAFRLDTSTTALPFSLTVFKAESFHTQDLHPTPRIHIPHSGSISLSRIRIAVWRSSVTF